jgi:hypothetical protein
MASYVCEMYTSQNAKNIHKRQTSLLIERMLRKDYYRKSSVGKESLVVGLKGLDAKMK